MRSFLGDVEALFRVPLVALAGGTITVGSLAVATLVIVASVLGARWAGRAIRRVASRGLSAGTEFAISKMVSYAILVAGVLVAIDSLGFSLNAIFAAAAVLLVGIGFGLQNIAQNFISGLILLIEQPIRKGDFIKVGDAYGSVDDIGLRATRIVTRDAVTIIVPNSELVGGQVVNHSRPTSILRIAVPVGVAYGSDPDRVKATLLEVAGRVADVLPAPPAEVRLEAFGGSSLDFTLLVWIADPRESLRIGSELRFAVVAAFARAGIEIPFPQRDLHLRSGFERLAPPPSRAG